MTYATRRRRNSGGDPLTGRRRSKTSPSPAMKLSLLAKLRIGAALLAALLLIGGYGAAVHPKLRMVVPRRAPNESPAGLVPGRVELETSTSSRVFGVVRMVLGAGLAGWVVWTLRLQPFRRP